MTLDVSSVARLLESSKRVLFITGAGVSADSGVPTYRGVGGLYEDADVEDGYSIEEILSGPMFRRNPALTWRYIAEIEAACRGREPNAAHGAIAALHGPDREVWVLTQNVDGLHRHAGSTNVIDIHGDVYTLICASGRCPYRVRLQSFEALEIPPSCPECGKMVRPDVVLFGEMLPDDKVETLHEQLGQGFDMVFSVGTSSLFPYIVAPVLAAAAEGIPTVEINPGPTTISGRVSHRLEARAAEAFRAIAQSVGISIF